jgi:hypothetical protein
MKLLIVLITIWGPLLAEVSRPDRSSTLMHLINQEMKILETAKRKGPDLNYRLLELHSEKLKLIHEKNNREFMEKSKITKTGAHKESFFGETRQYYFKTRDFGFGLMKQFPSTSYRAQVLYAMALNSRDYGKDNITEKYLLEAISLIKDPHHSLRHHAETAIADFYYNEKRFQDAITYYNRAIKKEEDEWLTKHLFNLSWCYLKVREFDKAISTIKDSYFKSKNRRYVNIKDQILDNIGSFYVYASRPLDGLDFYMENEKNPIPYLFPMAMKTMDKGHQRDTEVILASAQKLIDKNSWFDFQEELFHAYLDFYRHYSRFNDHEKTARELTAYYNKAAQDSKLKLPVAMKEEAVEKMRSVAGFLQVKLAKDMKQDEAHYREDELQIVLNYFSHLIQIDPDKKVEYFYFRAETYYSVRRFADAAPSYVEAVTEAKNVKNTELARKSLDSMLALTGMEVLPKADNIKFLISAYSEHLSLWPRDDKSEKIYPKLFEIYREALDDVKATTVLRSYNNYYPEHLKEQQTLMTKILDQFIDKKNTVKLANWIEEFKKGFLSFSKETIEKTEILLGNILFIQYQDLAKKGEKLAAAKGFESIYVHKLYPDKVKSQSAFFAALAYIEVGETVKSYYWQELAHARMTEEEKLSRREEQLKLAERTYKLQDFKTSFKLSELLLKKYCAKKDAVQDRFFEIAVMTSLVEENPGQAEKVVKDFAPCLLKSELKQTALAQIYQHYEKQADFYGLRLFVKRHPVEHFNRQYRYTLQKWYWEKSNLNLKDSIKEEFKVQGHAETKAWFEEINKFDLFMKEKKEFEALVIWDKALFEGEAFNKSLEGYLVKLQNLKTRYQALMQSTQLDLAIIATRSFAQVYRHVGETIQSQRPAGMDIHVFKDFSTAMKQLSSQFFSASTQYDKQLQKALKDKESITWGARSIASVEQVENPIFSFYTGLTMDKSRE